MNHLNNFESYINEALGIADATIFYQDLISFNVISNILSFIDSNPEVNAKEKNEIVIPYTSIRRFVTDWSIYKYFPVSEIVVYLTMTKKSSDYLSSFKYGKSEKEQVPFKLGGSALPFAVGREKQATRVVDPIKKLTDHSLSIHLELDFLFSDNFIKNRHEKKLETKIESVLLHELNHLYEYYCRKFKGSGKISLSTTYAAIGPNRGRRPKNIWEYWQFYFTDLIYQSEPHEVRAYVQEAKAYVDKLDFKTFKKTNIWESAKMMQTFDYKNFIEKINKVIYKHNPAYVDVMIDRLIKDFIRDYELNLKELKEDPIISLDTLRDMSRDQFFEFWQKKINKAGDTIVRKMIRLYSLKKEEGEDII